MRSYFTLIGHNCFFIKASLRSCTWLHSKATMFGTDFRFGASACPHVLVLILASFSYQYSKYRFVKPDTRRNRRTHPNHSPFPPSLPRFFILPFLIISRLFPSLDNTYRHNAANDAVAVHAPFYLIFISLSTLTRSLFNSLHRRLR